MLYKEALYEKNTWKSPKNYRCYDAFEIQSVRRISRMAVGYQHYVNTYEDANGNGDIFEDEINDDGLQLRANCYGYAMRIHYFESGLP